MKNKSKKKSKLKAWHLMPLSIIALIVAAVFVWLGRGDFSTRDVELVIEGPSQIENGKVEDYKLIIKNNSSSAIQDLNLTFESPSVLNVIEGLDEIRGKIERLEAGNIKEVPFKIVASSSMPKETINARLDYSPEGISARFVAPASLELIIGKLDVSVIFDLPQTIYSDQEITGSVIIIPHSDIETSPIFLRLDAPQGFRIQEVSNKFDFETVWRLGELKEEVTIKREFRGKLSTYEGEPSFKVSLGRLDGISFLPLYVAEGSINISESPLVLEQGIIQPTRGYIFPGERVTVKISYLNKAEIPLEDALIKVSLPKNIIDFSSIGASGGTVDEDLGTIEWTQAQLSDLRFTDVEETGSVTFSFRTNKSIVPANVQDINKSINIVASIRSQKESLAMGGVVLQAENNIFVKLATNFALQQDIYRQGGVFQNTGPNPPLNNQLSTYTVRWTLTNTTNAVRSAKVEAVLPPYAIWQDKTSSSSGDVRYISSTNTVVWDIGDTKVGIGFIYPEKTVEFQIGIIPTQSDMQAGLNILEQTKLTGIDTFTSSLVEQDIGEEAVPQ